MPWMSAPIFTSIRARSCTCGSQAALPITVCPGVSAAAISAFSVAITEGSSMNTSVGRSPPVAVEQDVAPAVHARAHRAEGVEMRVQAPAADHVAAGRGHHGALEARQQRRGEQEGGADLLGQLGLDLDAVHAGGAQRELVGPDPGDVHPELLEDRDHRLDVADAGHVAHEHLILGEDARGENRQRRVLVPGRGERAGERDAAFDDELLHGLRAPLAAEDRAGAAS